MTTTNLGSFLNVTGTLNPGTVIADSISGGDSDWRKRMEQSGATDRIEADYRKAIDELLPEDVWLTGEQFICDINAEVDFDLLREAIDAIDLDEIIARHDVDLYITPTVEAADIAKLLNSPAEHPVLHIQNGPDNDGTGELTLQVDPEAYVHDSMVVVRLGTLHDLLMTDTPDANDLNAVLPVIQESAEQVCSELRP